MKDAIITMEELQSCVSAAFRRLSDRSKPNAVKVKLVREALESVPRLLVDLETALSAIEKEKDR